MVAAHTCPGIAIDPLAPALPTIAAALAGAFRMVAVGAGCWRSGHYELRLEAATSSLLLRQRYPVPNALSLRLRQLADGSLTAGSRGHLSRRAIADLAAAASRCS